MNDKQPAEEMKREQVIDELRYHAHPSRFHSLLSRSTAELKALLVFYRENAKGNGERPQIGHVGIDRALPGAELSIVHVLEIRPRQKIGASVN